MPAVCQGLHPDRSSTAGSRRTKHLRASRKCNTACTVSKSTRLPLQLGSAGWHGCYRAGSQQDLQPPSALPCPPQEPAVWRGTARHGTAPGSCRQKPRGCQNPDECWIARMSPLMGKQNNPKLVFDNCTGLVGEQCYNTPGIYNTA